MQSLDADVLRQFSFDAQTFEDIKRAGRRSRSNSVTSIRSNYSTRGDRRRASRNTGHNDSFTDEELKGLEKDINDETKAQRKLTLGGRRGSFVEALGQDSVSAFLNTFDKQDEDEEYPLFSRETFMQVFVWPLSPDTFEMLIWNYCVVLIVVVSVLIETFIFGFQKTNHDFTSAKTVKDVCDCLFACHMLVSFRIGFWHNENGRWLLCMHSKDVAFKYLKTWFLLDLLSVFPFEKMVKDSTVGLTALLLIPRLLRFRKLFGMKDTSVSLYTGLTNNLFAFLLLTHILTCALAFIDQTYGVEGCEIAHSVMYDSASLGELYLSILAYTGKAIADMGSGAVTCSVAHSILELITTIVGMIVFATILGNINSYVSFHNTAKAQYLSTRQLMVNFLHQHGVTPALQQRCEKALQFGFIHRQTEKKICYKIETEYFLPESTIVEKGQENEKCYVFLRGNAICGPKFWENDPEPYYDTIGGGEYFGDQGLVLEQFFSTDMVKSVTYCEVASLSKKDLIEVLETDLQALARYHKMRQYAQRDTDNKNINQAALVIQRWWRAYRKATGVAHLHSLSDSLQANLVSAMTMKKPKRKKAGSTKKVSRLRASSALTFGQGN
ncbi:hypothetical protein HOP50_15g76450 [Chloropicon primus]|uniref:Cyclic nucleotide-binding domain-containing protein n=1 Tax=Chloropicon primus TaxID=1764295 RepID=A0A5B8MWZ4_9CHLO|nr:hypothetical protein A3770_15p76170 [Chloropicon primus]UPR04308.1 hypothetical protein HOP50_15g76450 [Chloropicon primus]|eukprot:QDZ25099.1 hypothetical protein A3770_15p76170 [Chloropicon primus]